MNVLKSTPTTALLSEAPRPHIETSHRRVQPATSNYRLFRLTIALSFMLLLPNAARADLVIHTHVIPPSQTVVEGNPGHVIFDIVNASTTSPAFVDVGSPNASQGFNTPTPLSVTCSYSAGDPKDKIMCPFKGAYVTPGGLLNVPPAITTTGSYITVKVLDPTDPSRHIDFPTTLIELGPLDMPGHDTISITVPFTTNPGDAGPPLDGTQNLGLTFFAAAGFAQTSPDPHGANLTNPQMYTATATVFVSDLPEPSMLGPLSLAAAIVLIGGLRARKRLA